MKDLAVEYDLAALVRERVHTFASQQGCPDKVTALREYAAKLGIDEAYMNTFYEHGTITAYSLAVWAASEGDAALIAPLMPPMRDFLSDPTHLLSTPNGIQKLIGFTLKHDADRDLDSLYAEIHAWNGRKMQSNVLAAHAQRERLKDEARKRWDGARAVEKRYAWGLVLLILGSFLLGLFLPANDAEIALTNAMGLLLGQLMGTIFLFGWLLMKWRKANAQAEAAYTKLDEALFLLNLC